LSILSSLCRIRIVLQNINYSEDSEEQDDFGEELSEENENSEENSDSFSDFEELKKKDDEKAKNEEHDLSKMTRRQKQAYLVKNHIIEVTEQSVNKKSGTIGLGDETVLYSLDPSRSTKKSKPELPRRVRKHKTVTLEEQAENQRQALTKILEEIDRKEKERDSKQKSFKLK